MKVLTSGEIDAIARRVVQYLTRDFVDAVKERAKEEEEAVEDELSFKQVMNLLDLSRGALHKRCFRGSIRFHKRGKAKFFYVKDIKPLLPYGEELKKITQDCTACEGSAVI